MRLFVLWAVLALHGCSLSNPGESGNVSSEALNTSAVRDPQPLSPVQQCLIECRNDANAIKQSCVKDAKGDPATLRECSREQKQYLKECEHLCEGPGPPDPTIPGS